MPKSMTVALVGNPNCGKTTLFNQLTGSSQSVGNWPGVTVEKKEGAVREDILSHPEKATVVDLPGIYSLSPYTDEEVVARDFILDQHPDVILNIVDATNLERNLYLTTQLFLLGRPVVVALNMMDVLEKKGEYIGCRMLQEKLGVPVLPISASKGLGIRKLMEAVHRTASGCYGPPKLKVFTGPVKEALGGIEGIVSQNCAKVRAPVCFAAVKLLEGDSLMERTLGLTRRQLTNIGRWSNYAAEKWGMDCEMAVADQRYRTLCDLCGQVTGRRPSAGRITLSERIDRVVTNKYLALPFFLLVMLLLFGVTFGPIGSWMQDMAASFIEGITGQTRSLLEGWSASPWSIGFLCDGVLAGVGSVISFFPQILLLFFLLSLLEDSGYMARAAFIMDGPLRKIGLTGRAFVPMLMGFGCTVPAALSTRTLENPRDRRTALMILPFLSCSARMPVYLLFAAAFFQRGKVLLILSLYLLGLLVAVLSAWILKKTVHKGQEAPFVMEMPSYHLPTLRGIGIHLSDKVKDFAMRAGTVLLGASIAIWFLKSFTLSLSMTSDPSQSILASMGGMVAPVLAPLGFGDWRSAVALLTGLMAKESVVSTLGVLYGAAGDAGIALTSALQSAYTPLSALSFLVFVLLYLPCVSAFSAVAKEMHSAKWTLTAVFYQLGVAWTASFAVYQVGRLLGLG